MTGTSNATNHSINYHHYRLYTTWLLQHITSLKDLYYALFVLLYDYHDSSQNHYMCICCRIVMPQTVTIAHP